MKKLCQPSPPVRRHRTLRRPPTHETSKLEEKLDGLVTLLKSATQGVPPSIINAISSHEGSTSAGHETVAGTMAPDLTAPGLTASSTVSNGEYAYSRLVPNGSGLTELNYIPTTSTSSISTPVSSLNLQPIIRTALEPSPEDAELYLNRFRSNFVKHFPFIIVSPSITAHQLRQDCPILWIAIMTVASEDTTQQVSMSKETREIFAKQVFVEGTRNMDILLAVLVYVIWCVNLGAHLLSDR